MSTLRSSSPGASTFALLPVTKSIADTVRSDPSGAQSVYSASSATAIVIIGPAGNDMQMLPPTVAVFHILNEARKASQLVAKSSEAHQLSGPVKAYSSRIVHMAPSSSPAADGVRVSQPSGARSINLRSCGCFSENSQVPPASQASPGCQI